jgi:hypothetical protein
MWKLYSTSPILAGLLFLAAGGIALASADGEKPAQVPAAGRSADPSTEVSVEELVKTLNAAGYTRIRGIERKGTSYEIKATDAGGQRVELLLDARNGQTLRREKDAWEDDAEKGDNR